MKRTVCWLLMMLMVLGGCVHNTPTVEEIQEKVNMPLQNEPTTEPAIDPHSEEVKEIPPIEGYESFMTVLSARLFTAFSSQAFCRRFLL